MEPRESLEHSSSENLTPQSILNGSRYNGGSEVPTSGQTTLAPQSTLPTNESSPVVDSVLQSDIAINTLLMRLKQSVASAREFAAFLKKRSTLEEEQAQGLKKVCRSSRELAKRPDNRQGSYAQNYDEILGIHDRMADNGVQFALFLHQMHEDLHDLAANIERGRKHWKQSGLSAEKRVQDSESFMERAKSKYDSLAEDYDRTRTGDKQSGRVFGLKGPKSAAQHEEDLLRKVQQADSDYSSRVQSAKIQRLELVSTLRPQAVRALQDLIKECDSGLTLQLQKFASFNERLLLGNGLCISPLKGQGNDSGSRSLRNVVSQIDNASDLNNFVSSFASKVGNTGEIKYERHPTLTSSQQNPSPINARNQPMPNHESTTLSPSGQTGQPGPLQGQSFPQASASPSAPSGSISVTVPQNGMNRSPQDQNVSSVGNGGPPQLPPTQTATSLYSQPPTPIGMKALQKNTSSNSLPALKPVFGLSLEDLLKRDNSPIPLVVHQCIQAVDLYGLEVEGIYRLSGSTAHVSKLRSLFDNDSNQLDFRNPEAFFHDVNSVAGLLKQFFRDLPDPLLTHEHYQGFIEAARIDDDITRRDSMHAIINSLPDPNYATLRTLTLHLYRVQEHSAVNRMNAGNLAIIFGPTLMGTGPNVADAGWQVRVIDTILQNTYQIFDDD